MKKVGKVLLTLPPEKRRGIYALYSFCRVVDDCVDESDGDGAAGLDRWLEEIDRCYRDGTPTSELGRELVSDVQARGGVMTLDDAQRFSGDVP